MRKHFTPTLILLASSIAAHAQIGRTLDWPTYGGSLQRTGWERAEVRFTKDDIAKEFQFLAKMKPQGGRGLFPPVILGTLVGYRGFKELAFVGAANDGMYVYDADLYRLYWEKRFGSTGGKPASAGCPGGMTAAPTLRTMAFRPRGPRPAPPKPGTPAARPQPNPAFAPRAVYLISSDGMLRRLNVSDGSDFAPPQPVIPAHAKASTLNLSDDVLYTTTGDKCGGAQNAIYAIDISDPEPTAKPKINSFVPESANFVGMSGPVVGADGTIYVQTGDGVSDPASKKYGNTLLALSPKTLELKGYFTAGKGRSGLKPGMNEISPVIFTWKEKELIVSGGRDGRLSVLDAHSLDSNHETALSQTEPVGGADGGLWGGLSSWEDSEGTRYVLATVWGANGAANNGSIVAYKLEDEGGKPVLKQAWVSRDLVKPVPPVIASGVVFAMSTGDAASKTKAVVYALDGATGKELWSTKDQVTAPGTLNGLTIANGRLFFTTTDGTLWIFGVPLEV